jgi:hypothetical protein
MKKSGPLPEGQASTAWEPSNCQILFRLPSSLHDIVSHYPPLLLSLSGPLTYKGQTRPLVREGVPQRQNNKFQTQTLEKEVISGQTSTKWARYQDVLTD